MLEGVCCFSFCEAGRERGWPFIARAGYCAQGTARPAWERPVSEAVTKDSAVSVATTKVRFLLLLSMHHRSAAARPLPPSSGTQADGKEGGHGR